MSDEQKLFLDNVRQQDRSSLDVRHVVLAVNDVPQTF
jgi:hypothetical protein